MNSIQKILFLGCGKMGSALANCLLKNGVESSKIKAIDVSQSHKISEIEYFSHAKNLPEDYQADIVFLAIKPQDSENILREFVQANRFHKKTIFISILAGKKIKFFKDILGSSAKIIRSMPNLPILEGQGIFAYYLSKNIKINQEENITEIFKNFGEIIKLEDEKLFDVITAVSGSGPAYIFMLEEIFTNILIENKISAETSKKIVKKLFLGSALMAQNHNADFSQLRESVTSKNGTTAAALEVLQNNNALEKLFKKAVSKAVKRSKELSK